MTTNRPIGQAAQPPVNDNSAMPAAHNKQLHRWQRRYPSFDWQQYLQWVTDRGYYRSALDTEKPEFTEYASLFVQQMQLASERGRGNASVG